MTETLRKTVSIKAVNEEARTATGAVLVPNELDHQHDFLRPDAVDRFHADDPDTGIMHSAFDDSAAELERNEVIAESETIGDETFPPGTWVATRRYEDDDLWHLVNDGVLQGFSIGGEISRAADHETLPDDVRVPDAVDHEDDGGTELLAGTVNEVSDVDIPAVPRASYKSDLGKSLLDETDGEAEFVELMVEQRGHEESEARALYQYLINVRGKTTRRDALENVGKPFESPEGAEFEDFEDCVETLTDGDMTQAEAETVCGAWQEEDKSQMSDTTDDGIDDATKLQVIKSWLTGSDDDVSPESGQSEATAKATDGDDEEDDDEDDEDEMDNGKSADMTDDTIQSDPPEWAKSLTETVEQIDERVDKLEGDDADEDAEKADDAPEWAEDLAEKVEDLDQRVDAISKQSGHSQQLDATEKNADDDMDEAEKFKAGLVGRQ